MSQQPQPVSGTCVCISANTERTCLVPETPKGLLYGIKSGNFGGVTYDDEQYPRRLCITHFARWFDGVAPPALGLQKARNNAASGSLYMSSEAYNTSGIGDGDLAVKVDLVRWNREWNIGIFRCAARTGAHLGVGQLLERTDLDQQGIIISPADMALTYGYNDLQSCRPCGRARRDRSAGRTS